MLIVCSTHPDLTEIPIDSNYFPTGIEWEETSVDLGLGADSASSTTHYEIGEETTVDDQLYRKVLINGAESSLFIREEVFRSDDGKEWITYILGSPVTSIPDASSMSKGKNCSRKTYTTSGQQTKVSRRGIYIRDGEKFMVK